MCNFENILQFLHFSIALDMSSITHFLVEIMNPKNSASRKILTFSMSDVPRSQTNRGNMKPLDNKIAIPLGIKWMPDI